MKMLFMSLMTLSFFANGTMLWEHNSSSEYTCIFTDKEPIVDPAYPDFRVRGFSLNKSSTWHSVSMSAIAFSINALQLNLSCESTDSPDIYSCGQNTLLFNANDQTAEWVMGAEHYPMRCLKIYK